MSDIEKLIRSIVRDELAKTKPANDDVEWLSRSICEALEHLAKHGA